MSVMIEWYPLGLAIFSVIFSFVIDYFGYGKNTFIILIFAPLLFFLYGIIFEFDSVVLQLIGPFVLYSSICFLASYFLFNYLRWKRMKGKLVFLVASLVLYGFIVYLNFILMYAY